MQRIKQAQRNRVIEVLGKTRNRSVACASAGVSREWFYREVKKNQAFADRASLAVAMLDQSVTDRIFDVLMHGAPYETTDRDGNVVTLRKYCSKTTLAYATKFLGWGDRDVAEAQAVVKDVRFLDAEGTAVPFKTLLKRGIEASKQITIDDKTDAE